MIQHIISCCVHVESLEENIQAQCEKCGFAACSFICLETHEASAKHGLGSERINK